ncbi:DNA damage-regulated autophagy modulator protein 2-like [Watersipora subatra]|uniref:DNA damage-regulated autophagy modulator protein 2-like n=1 Tax=Watersipora subatra TaxID=2589382 RepID=UPI00355C42E8
MNNLMCILPILGSALALFTFLISYFVAVLRGDVYPWWPFISDTGTTVPESCIFGELLTLTAISALVAMVIRYKWIELFNTDDKKLRKFNIIGLVIGGLSCFFMTMVANFQETKIRDVHMPVSAATFGLALVYNILQTEITRRMSPQHSTICVWTLRLLISVAGAISFTLLYGFGLTSDGLARSWYGNDSEKRLHWKPTDPDWDLHIVASISEWCVGITVVLFYLTFCYEFSKIKLRLIPERVEASTDDDAPLLS